MTSNLTAFVFCYRNESKMQRSSSDPSSSFISKKTSATQPLPELRCTFLGAKNVGKSTIINSLERSGQISTLFNLRAREITTDDYPAVEKLQHSDVLFIVFSCTDEYSWLTARQLHVYLQQQQISIPVFFIGTHAAMAWKQDRVYFDLACLDMKVNLLLSCGDTTPWNLVSTLEELYRKVNVLRESSTELLTTEVASVQLWVRIKMRVLTATKRSRQ